MVGGKKGEEYGEAEGKEGGREKRGGKECIEKGEGFE